jgi:ribonucleoside-diphosphate reductase subunit M2
MSAVETPSKAVAASLDNIDLSKPSAPKFLDSPAASSNSIKKEHKSAATVDATTTGPTGRDRFVGNLDITCDADEPLLKETGNRFVLFPIKYHEVSNSSRVVVR